MRARIAMVAVALAVVASFAAPGAQAVRDQPSALDTFTARVEAYAQLHRRVAEPLPPLLPTEDVRSTFLARRYLASAICAARGSARQGDIFAPPVTAMFRRIIAAALAGRDPEEMLRELKDEQSVPLRAHPVVNEPYPLGFTHEVPVILLQSFPALPPELQYQIVDHDLVLWDGDANLVIDFIPDAFVGVTTTTD